MSKPESFSLPVVRPAEALVELAPAPLPRSCGNCRFWHDLKRGSNLGECRKYALPPRRSGSNCFWSETNYDQWCGEFQPNPAA